MGVNGGPWEKYAAPAAQPASAPAGEPPWIKYQSQAAAPAAPAPPQNSSIAADVAKSGGVGLVEGLIGSAGMLGDVNDLLGRGTAWVASKLAGDQVDAATRAALDAIAPPSATPSTLGPRAAAAAQGRLDATRRDINTATAPAYRAAERHLLDAEAFAPIAADPAFQASLRRLKADEVLGPTYRDMPDQSVAVVDAVTKDMRDRGVALSNAANPGFSSQAAGLYGAGAADARSIARDPARGGSAAYDEALTQQAQARRQQLEPLEQGPLGRIAAASTTPAAYAEILPARPLSGGTDEVVAAVMGLERQDPGLPATLVRQSLADSFDQARRRIATGENQSVGGRFANAVAGTPEQRANLDAILEAVARPDARDQVSDLFDVLRATSRRRPMGSPTEANRMVNEGLDRIGIPMALASAPASAGSTFFREIGDRLRLGARDRSLSRLADLVTAPDSVERLRELAMQPQTFPMADLLRRQVVQTPAAIEAGR